YGLDVESALNWGVLSVMRLGGRFGSDRAGEMQRAGLVFTRYAFGPDQSLLDAFDPFSEAYWADGSNARMLDTEAAQSLPFADKSVSLPRQAGFAQPLRDSFVLRHENGLIRPVLVAPSLDGVLGRKFPQLANRRTRSRVLARPRIAGCQVCIGEEVIRSDGDRPLAPLDRSSFFGMICVRVAH